MRVEVFLTCFDGVFCDSFRLLRSLEEIKEGLTGTSGFDGFFLSAVRSNRSSGLMIGVLDGISDLPFFNVLLQDDKMLRSEELMTDFLPAKVLVAGFEGFLPLSMPNKSFADISVFDCISFRVGFICFLLILVRSMGEIRPWLDFWLGFGLGFVSFGSFLLNLSEDKSLALIRCEFDDAD